MKLNKRKICYYLADLFLSTFGMIIFLVLGIVIGADGNKDLADSWIWYIIFAFACVIGMFCIHKSVDFYYKWSR